MYKPDLVNMTTYWFRRNSQFLLMSGIYCQHISELTQLRSVLSMQYSVKFGLYNIDIQYVQTYILRYASTNSLNQAQFILSDRKRHLKYTI